MAAVILDTELLQVPCPTCGKPVIRERRGVRVASGRIISEWYTYACSSGSRHLPLGWEPPR